MSLLNEGRGLLEGGALIPPFARTFDSESWQRLPEGSTGVNGFSVSLKGGFIAASSYDHFVYLWRLDDWTLVRKQSGHRDEVWSIAVAPDGRTIASGGQDQKVVLWDAQQVRHNREFDREPLKISPNGEILAIVTARGSRHLQLWNIVHGHNIGELETGHTRGTARVRFSPGGRLMTTFDVDTTVKIWEVGIWHLLHTLQGHKRGVFDGDFSPDGQTLVTVNDDQTVRLWNPDTGRELAAFCLDWIPTSAGFSRDGRFLYVEGLEETINGDKGYGRIWKAPTWDEISANAEQ